MRKEKEERMRTVSWVSSSKRSLPKSGEQLSETRNKIVRLARGSSEHSVNYQSFFGEMHEEQAATSDSHSVFVRTLLTQMLHDQTVVVKLLHTCFEIQSISKTILTEKSADTEIYTGIVGCTECEYPLIAFGSAAYKAKELLASLRGQVVRLSHTSQVMYAQESQLQLLLQFTVEVVHLSIRSLYSQNLNRIFLSQLRNWPDRSKLHLLPCMVLECTKVVFDANHEMRRITRVSDLQGAVISLVVHNHIAEKIDVWEKGAVIDVTDAYLNRGDGVIEIGNNSQVDLCVYTEDLRFSCNFHRMDLSSVVI
jgi:hypothetical protein